jgi:small-conductance mechanosensitive channel
MADALPVVGQPSFLVRFLLTVVVVAGVLVVRVAARRWRQSHDTGHKSTEKIAVAAAVAVLTALGVVFLVEVWGLTNELSGAISGLGDEDTAGKLLVSGVLLGATYALTTFVGRVIQEATSAAGVVSKHQREIVYRLTQVGLYSVVALVILGLFTRNIGSLLVGAGFLGIVVGMAARQTLGSVLAGFVLMFSRPFEIGDWVEVGQHEGTVTDITIVNTRLQTFDGEYVVVPNDVVSGESIVNRSRKGRLRVEVEVSVDYDAAVDRAVEVAREAVDGLEEVLDVPTPQVVVKRFDDSSVVLGVRAWIDNPSARRKWRARTAVVDAVKSAFEAEGIKIPFPQRELTARPEAEGFRVRGSGVDARTGAQATADGGRSGEETGSGGGDGDPTGGRQ